MPKGTKVHKLYDALRREEREGKRTGRKPNWAGPGDRGSAKSKGRK
jgi:hypothetical protein